MPDAPTNSMPDGAPQVQPGAGFTPNLSPDAFGAGIGRALDGVAGEMQRYAMYEKRYNDQEASSDALTKVGMARMKIHQDLQNTDFQNPIDLHASAIDARNKWQSHVDDVANSLTNDHQRATFQRGLRSEQFHFQNGLDQFELQTRNKIEVQGTAGFLKVQQADAARNYDQPPAPGDPSDPSAKPAADYVSGSIAAQKARIADMGQHLHWSPDQVESAQAAAVNATHVGVLQTMLRPGQDAAKAAAYYDKVKGDLFPAEQDHLGKAVEAVTLQQQTGAITHELMYDKQGRPRDEADVLDSLATDKRLQGDDRLATAVEASVGRTFRLQKAAKTQEQEQTFDGLWNNMGKAGGDIDQFPAEVVQSLTPEHQRQLQAYGKQIQEGKLTPDNSDAYYALRRQAATNPESFKGVDLRGYRSDLSAKNYAELIGVQAEVMGKPPPPGTQKGLNVVSTKEQIMKPVLKGLNDKESAAFQRDVDNAVEAGGGMEKVGTAGLQKIVDGLTITQHSEREAKGPWEWFTTPFGQKVQEDKPRWRTLPEGYAFAAHQIPPEASAHVAELLRARGITNPSEDQLLATYNAGLTHAGP